MLTKIASKYIDKLDKQQPLTEQQFVAMMTPKAKKAWKAAGKEVRTYLLTAYNNPKPLKKGQMYARRDNIDINDKGHWLF